MAKFWADIKWFLLAAFVGNMCGAIGWSFRTLAANIRYSTDNPFNDPALPVPSHTCFSSSCCTF
jgi:hypothetical protein